ncbi:hypothetical protein PN441_07290 [Spirulina major CS-329]|uniref:hypothetical protein n=1 Tax=Spirulina TaxID=1154 RepID=UPI00232E5747|nr:MULTISPECIES: hypothetical protein [Spirulina]MDB9495976.1 hypothetical protein [Spirulina subsalsa CS-330]MDB9502871.1 hypothetical protein [Spirulina major CS-329]
MNDIPYYFSENMNHPKTYLTFHILESQKVRLEQWMLAIDTQIATKQIETGRGLGERILSTVEIKSMQASIEQGQPCPDYGAMHGAYRYSFTPTSLGTVVKVENVVSGDAIDLSEYEHW